MLVALVWSHNITVKYYHESMSAHSRIKVLVSHKKTTSSGTCYHWFELVGVLSLALPNQTIRADENATSLESVWNGNLTPSTTPRLSHREPTRLPRKAKSSIYQSSPGSFTTHINILVAKGNKNLTRSNEFGGTKMTRYSDSPTGALSHTVSVLLSS